MKKYLVNVNGEDYEITLEVLDDGDVQPKPSPKQAPANHKILSSSLSSQKITAPMPGTILSIQVKSGQLVKKGDVLMILEAMKMENEIMAPVDGTITSISTSQGTTVETGTLLCCIN